jgi:hypothetical protein
MSLSRFEIQNLFINELLVCEEHDTVLKIKEYIKNTISIPNIQEMITYTFEIPQTVEQIKNIKLCMILEFGFYSDEITNEYCIIDMKKFF